MMIFKNKFFIGVGLLIFILLDFIFGFYIGGILKPTYPQISYRIDAQKSRIIEKQYFYFTGQVTEVDAQNNMLTLTGGGESAKIHIKKDAPIESYAFRQNDKTPNEQPKYFAFKDILVGDKASVYAEVQKDGKPLGINVYIHFVPVKAF